MTTFQAIIFFAMGTFLLALAWRGLARGWLPFGSRAFLQPLHLHRASSAAGFWLAFATYAVAGLAMIVYAVLLAAGAAAPMPFSR